MRAALSIPAKLGWIVAGAVSTGRVIVSFRKEEDPWFT
jgi:hypothetical protein